MPVLLPDEEIEDEKGDPRFRQLELFNDEGEGESEFTKRPPLASEVVSGDGERLPAETLFNWGVPLVFPAPEVTKG